MIVREIENVSSIHIGISLSYEQRETSRFLVDGRYWG